jgi:hypothetical protein
MAIEQPPSITEHDRALPLFADRLAERRLFLRYLHTEPPLERMLFFHGDGGNGKSLLLKLLLAGYCRRLPAADWARLEAIADDRACVQGYDALARSADEGIAIPCVYHDFAARGSAEDDPRGYWSGPLMIGRSLGAQGLKLPLFDHALMLYLRGRGQLSAERIKALFPAAEADFAGALFDLTARPSKTILGAAHQQITRAWWDRRSEYDLVVSEAVLRECAAGDPEAARKRLEAAADLPILLITEQALEIAQALVERGIIPPKAAEDGLHIAAATVYRIDYLLTWNCSHIANPEIQRGIAAYLDTIGLILPFLCTPEELLGDDNAER